MLKTRMLVLFDIDDTLVDHGAAARAAASMLHATSGCTLDAAEFHVRWLESTERHFTRYIAGELTLQEQRRQRVRETISIDFSDDAADELFETYLAEYERGWSLYPDVLPCFADLAEHELGVVSNGSARQQRLKLSQLGLLAYLQCVVISEEFGAAKPDPRIFLHACQLRAASPADTVYVGDRVDVDVVGAARAGLRPVWLDRQDSGGAGSAESATRIETLGDLPAILSIRDGRAG